MHVLWGEGKREMWRERCGGERERGIEIDGEREIGREKDEERWKDGEREMGRER